MIILWINIHVSPLQSLSSEISAHMEHYQTLCEQFHTIIKKEEKEEIKEKFEELKICWDSIQVQK